MKNNIYFLEIYKELDGDECLYTLTKQVKISSLVPLIEFRKRYYIA
jgi:hypothetical protein